jgi:uncharacterized protein
MELTIANVAASSLAITTGAVLQASTGLGAGLVVVPLLALISLDLVPGPVIFASMALSSLMTYAGRRHITWSHLDKVLWGLAVGMLTGILGLSALPPSQVGLVFGALILFATAVSVLGVSVKPTSMNALAAGILSGFMGTVAAIGAPVLALLYQHEEAKALRGTLALLYLLSSIGMLILLHVAGRFSWHEAILGGYLIPGFVMGYLLSGPISRVLDRGYSRVAVLLISSVSGLVLIVKSLL